MSLRYLFAAVACLPSLVHPGEKMGEMGDFCPPRAILASARPCPSTSKDSWGGLITSASFIFWQAKTNGLEFASKSFEPNTPGANLQTFNEKLFFPDFAWKPGVKGNIGWNLPYDGWDVIGSWTYFHTNFTSLKKHIGSQITPSGLGVIPLWRYPFIQFAADNSNDPIRYQSASGNWKLSFNSGNLELGRLFFPNKSLPLRLHMGAKAAIIDQHYHVDYQNGTTVLGIFIDHGTDFEPFELVGSRFTFKSKHWGIGPRTGLESRWNLGWNFRLIADASLSILCSFFDLTTKYDDGITNIPNNNAIFEMEEDFRELTPVVEGMLGIDWGMCICKTYLNLAVGYEVQYWWAINHARRNYVQSVPAETFDMRGDLQMQGLTATLKLDF